MQKKLTVFRRYGIAQKQCPIFLSGTIGCILMIIFTVLSTNAQTNFVKYTGSPVLPLGSPGEWDDLEAGYADILFDGATYQMWYSGAHVTNTYRIGYAISSDGINWDKQGLVLENGTPGAFDGISTWLPEVLFDGTDYKMWYTGNISDGGIGYITTTDPASWIRQRTTPVLTGDPGWDENRVFGPVVLHKDSLYQMWFGGEQNGIWQTGYATSADGINWTKHPNNPVLTVGAGEWDATAAIVGSVIFDDGIYHMWYHGTNGSATSGSKIGYATSPDGINWTKHPGNPILTDTPNSWDNENVWFPRVIKDGKRYRLWYTGRGNATGGFDRIGYAEDFSALSHTESVDVDVSYSAPGTGDIQIDAAVVNPDAHTLSATALILSSDGSVTDSTTLTDAGGGIWHSSWPIPNGERSYSVGVRLRNMDTGYTNNGHDWDIVDRFTTIGPITVDSDTITQQAPLAFALKLFLRNNSVTATATNVTAELSTDDPTVTEITGNPRSFGDVPAGQVHSSLEYIVFTPTDVPKIIAFKLRMFSDGYFFWEDTFSVFIDPTVGIEVVNTTLPERYHLEQNYPNPFNPSTLIRFSLPKASQVDLQIFNVLGQSVRTLVSENLAAGEHTAVWDGKNDAGLALPSGTYFYRIKAGDFKAVKKMLLLK
jgi:hypothetical protein